MGRITFIVIFLFSLCGLAAGQGAHYTYPFVLECPEGMVSPGDTVSVAANPEGGHAGDRYSPTYNWSTSGGVIESGQGTPKISLTIGTVEAANIHVTLTRTFLEAHFPGVQREATCTIAVVPTPVARMTDEFRTAGNNCEDGLARLDAFLVDLYNDPASSGVIVAYGEIGNDRSAGVRMLQLRKYANFRRFDTSRLTFVTGIARESGTTQFWIVPPGADRPEVSEAPNPDPKYRPKLPYMFAARYFDGVPECTEYDYDLAEFARVLNIEPKARARVIIRESSRTKFNREAKELISVLVANGVRPSRVLTVYKYVRPNRLAEGTELWVIPVRN